MKFELGAETNDFVGNFGFDTAKNSSFGGIVTGDVSKNGFNGYLSNGTLNGAVSNSMEGSINGNFFGTDSIKSVGGIINIDSDIGKAVGSFKADETEQDLDIKMPIVPEAS